MLDIEGIDKGELLSALFNNSAPLGMGFLQAHLGPQVMTKEQAWEVINKIGDDSTRNFGRHVHSNKLYFDYLYGRPLKVDLSQDTADDRLYDRDNGNGSFARIVSEIRSRHGS
jgi:hypothetical protein